MPYILRPYQQECVDIMNQTENGKHLICLATGLGKTVVFSHINKSGRTLILSHRDELVRQPEKYYDCSFGIEKAAEQSDGEDVVSASVQSLCKDNRLSRFKPDEFDTIIVDEAHHAIAPSYKKILNYFSGARRIFGMTATPRRGDDVGLSSIFDDIIYSKDLRWGIKKQYLSPVRCKMVKAAYSTKGIKKTAGDFNLGEIGDKMNDPLVLATAAKTYIDNCHNRRHTLIYCVQKNTCYQLLDILKKLIPDAEDKIKIITGDTPQEERDIICSGFLSGNIECIINCMVLTEGTDLPICDCIFNLRPTCNASLYQQIVGRGTRLYEGKKYCLVIDLIPDDGERRLCTAPTLFGINPSLLTKKERDKIDENVDLLDFCDSIGAEDPENIVKTIDVYLAAINRFVDHRMEMVNAASSINELAEIYGKYLEETRKDTEDMFGDLIVEELPDDQRAYLIHPNFDDKIYLSKPDVLNKTTIRFEKAKGVCSVGELTWNEALGLAREYCICNSERVEFKWSRPAREAWGNEPCTDRQAEYLEDLCSEYDLHFTERTINKRTASDLIEMCKHIKKNNRELAKQKDNLQKKLEKSDKKARKQFSSFKEQIEKEYMQKQNTI